MSSSSQTPPSFEGSVHLRLYVAGSTLRSLQATHTLQGLAPGDGGPVAVEVIDVLKEPQRAEEDGVLATPTLLRVSPGPPRRIVGDLSDLGRIATALALPLPPRREAG